MRILITGSNGFIAYHLIKQLIERIDVSIIGIDNSSNSEIKNQRFNELIKSDIHNNYICVPCSITDIKSLEDIFDNHKFDIVIHLAGMAGVRQSLKCPDLYMDTNVNGFHNILKCCVKYGIKNLIYASSSSVYGETELKALSENDNTDSQQSIYAATKKIDEILAQSYSNIYGINAVGLRFFTVYGPFGRDDMFYSTATKKMLNDETIKIFNNGQMKRDFTYVKDVVECIMRIVFKGIKNSNIYNIGNECPVDLMDFVNVLKDSLVKVGLLNKDYDLESHIEYVGHQKGDVKNTFADMSRFYNEYGCKPNTDIETGLLKFSEWWKEWKGNA